MSDSQWRIDLARDIAKHYDAKAIILAGSSAIGLTDAYSDLDIVVYWDKKSLPQDSERFSIAENLGGNEIEIDPVEHQAEFSLQELTETFYLKRLKIDVTHKTVLMKETMIRQVVEELDTDRAKMTLLHSLTRAIPLKGIDLVKNWREQFEPMPEALIEKMLPDYLHVWAYQPLQKLAVDRNDALFSRQLLDQTCEKLLVALCLLNRQYPPFRMKHLVQLAAALEHKPTNFVERIAEICNQPAQEALVISKTLVEDTFDIAEKLAYDVSAARTHYQTVRRATFEPIRLKENHL